MGGDGKLAEKPYSTWSQTVVMDNLATSTHPGYFKRQSTSYFQGCILLSKSEGFHSTLGLS